MCLYGSKNIKIVNVLMKILVTGSTGFIGRHLVPKLLAANFQVLELTRDTEKSYHLFGNRTEKHQLDDNQDSLLSIINNYKPEIVIHLASYLTSLDDYNSLNKLLSTNITFFCHLLDALKENKLKLFINTGTCAEYYYGDEVFDPAYLYAATKTASRVFLDYYSKLNGYKQATVVPYTVYGGNDSQKKVIDIIYESIDSETPVDMSPGEQVLDFIHIDDVTDFYMKLIEKNNDLPYKSNFKLGTGRGHTLKQVAEIIENITRKKTNINWGGKEYRKSDVLYAVAKISEIQELNVTINLNDGICSYIKARSGC